MKWIIASTIFISSLCVADTTFYAYENQPYDAMYDLQCMPCTETEVDGGTIFFTDHWKVVYDPNQSYLGRTVVIPKRHFAWYEEMTDAEAREYQEILKALLPALRKTFDVTYFNICALMNLAFHDKHPIPSFKDGKPNPHFHWHIIPRYDGPRYFDDTEFVDPEFGRSYNLKRKEMRVGLERRKAIDALRENLQITFIDQRDGQLNR